MKKIFIIISIPVIALNSCKKETEKIITKNEVKVVTSVDSNGVKKTDSVAVFSKTIGDKTTTAKNKIERYEYVYSAFDGTEANITFTHYPDKSFILIERNHFKIELPQTEAWAKGAIYEKDGIKAEAQGDKLTITQNGQTFELNRKK